MLQWVVINFTLVIMSINMAAIYYWCVVWCRLSGRGRGRKRARTDSAATPTGTPPKLPVSARNFVVKESPRKTTSHGVQLLLDLAVDKSVAFCSVYWSCFVMHLFACWLKQRVTMCNVVEVAALMPSTSLITDDILQRDSSELAEKLRIEQALNDLWSDL